jgi:hypothetical protein
VIAVKRIIKNKSTKAIIGFFNLKNKVVQIKFNANCIKKKVNGEQYGKHFLWFHNIYVDTNILKYNIGHTIPKIYGGGVKLDFLSVLYQGIILYISNI